MEQLEAVVIGGGQSGLAAAHALRREGVQPVVLEASTRAAGSWPRYYDSLTLFSPARYSALPGLPFPGDPDRYPHRDEVVSYLASCVTALDADIRPGSRVEQVRADGPGFTAELEGGGRLAARTVVAATGTFGHPYRPSLPGLESFSGEGRARGRVPQPAAVHRPAGARVGAGNSAVQIAAELAAVTSVTLANRNPVKFARQRILGRDLHFWLARTGLDAAPLGRVLSRPPVQPVIDDGRYRTAAGAPRRRPLFTRIEGRTALWPGGHVEDVDTLLLATGYRPDLPYLAQEGALDAQGRPLHRAGASLTHPGLAFVGLEWQRSLSSNSLRGVGRDAARTVRRLAGHLRGR
ncbi:flavin-containing monooxygenase [Streptomyces sp. H34-S4]|uniref:flavin-containing monooxygenase n=1 Tax=Streptomyces sp. H34-S4 TaxID=2996463 RepID=UPI0022709AA4|nr:NAD(P)/FAD-dependent oxidoreductase [Streptomyces sp. H34-S4]MCY0937581.1 NAD(P)/FAD-dependent oxidoreductase [Streptomyces sp. H34-S4]